MDDTDDILWNGSEEKDWLTVKMETVILIGKGR